MARQRQRSLAAAREVKQKELTEGLYVDSYLIRFGSTIIPKIPVFQTEKQNHRPTESETLEVGPRNLGFNKPSW